MSRHDAQSIEGPDSRVGTPCLVGAAVAVTAFAGLTGFVIAGWTQTIDDAWNTAMVNSETPWLLAVADFFHYAGAFPIALATVVLVTFAFLATRRWWMAGAWVAMVAVSQALSVSIKALLGRERPLEGLVFEPSAAYPSGHTLVSGLVMAVGLALLVGIIWPHRARLFIVVGIVYALLMAWSRTYLRAHWLTDVVGSLLLGTAILLVVVALIARRSARAREAESRGSP